MKMKDIFQRLAKFGFVHVTGLTTYVADRPQYVIAGHVGSLGKHDSNNGTFAIVDYEGRVFISVLHEGLQSEDFKRILKDVAPDQGVYVPCSNGESVYSRDLLSRLADPQWCGYRNEAPSDPSRAAVLAQDFGVKKST